MDEKDLKKTHIYKYHAEHGNVIDFGGFAMPVWYEGIKVEHAAVRDACGIFDTCHMGRTWATGPDVIRFLNYVVTNDVTTLEKNGGLYSVMCRPTGGIIDDLILYKINDEKFWVVYNASNRDKDFKWLKKNSKDFDVKLKDVSDEVAMIAVQGPKAEEVLQKITEQDLSKVERFNIAELTVSGYEMMAARTGYTGEDGFELYIPDTTPENPEKALKVWNDLIGAGAVPCGLGARDSLRLEAGLWLYGNDMDESINPLEARLGWTVKLEKEGYFVGQRAIQKMKDEGITKTLVGIKMEERGIPRHGYPVLNMEEEEIGLVTSGGLSPTLGYGIAMAYVPPEYRKRGTELNIEIRGKPVKGKVVKYRPFYDDSVYGWKRDK
ncbi:MAG: glycine cleavage system aminomethyltransferase GcvT [Candidatus Bathyarchaeota archaeon]|nr:glycine cleavage system aminomethyltransferase GcvT [Candidatus Bathyarchaeota archaeon]